MITFFTIPKPFSGLSDVIQRNAIHSWQRLSGDSEILIFGDDLSVVNFANDHHIQCISDYKSNDYGTPLLDGIWSAAHENAKYDYICYINTDIILFPDFIAKATAVKLEKFFLAGRRWDVEIDTLIDFDSDWISYTNDIVREKGILHKETGVDYFMFPKSCMPEMPAFAVGRGWWDNWLIYDFRRRKIPIIDGTEIMTVHQNHDYSHVKSTTTGTSPKGLERTRNGELAKLPYWNLIYISDADYRLSSGDLLQTPFSDRLSRYYYRFVKLSVAKLLSFFR